MKPTNLIYLLIVLITITSCKINIQGKKIKAKDICGDCNPGNHGKYMIMNKKTFEPEINDNSTPETIAYSILGHVFPANNLTGSIKVPCSQETVKSPFGIDDITKLGGTGSNGTYINYSEKENLEIEITSTVNSDLESIKEANPSISATKLDEFKAKLNNAYSKFANKELYIKGKYYQFGLKDKEVLKVAKDIEYNDCRSYIYNPEREKRMITAIGLVYFDIESSENSVDKIASELQTEAAAYGITFNISAKFKRNISRELEKATKDYYQIITWRTVGVSELEVLR